MRKPYHVLVIDDKEEVCRRISERLAGRSHLIWGAPNEALDVVCSTVHVSLQQQVRDDSQWTFAPATWRALKAAADNPPDLIIIDYIYVDRQVSTEIKAWGEVEEVRAELVKGKLLTPIDLKHWALESPQIPDGARRSIRRAIFNTRNPVYLHSYTPPGLSAVVGSMDDRRRRLQEAFPRCRTEVVDTRSAFFNNEEFDWPNTARRYDSRYYPYQLAVFFEQVVKVEIALNRLRLCRFLRIQRTVASVASIAAIGAGIGFAGAWIGSLVHEIARGGAVSNALIIGIAFLAVLLILGAMCPFLFDKLMNSLLTPTEQSQDR